MINIQSEIGGKAPFAEARVAIEDFGYRKHQLKAGGAIGRLDYLVSLSDLSIDGYRAHSEAENTQLNSRFQFRVNDSSRISLTFSASDQPLSNDPGGVTLADATQNPRAARDRNVASIAGEALDQKKIGLSYKHTLQNGGIVAFDRFFAGGGARAQHLWWSDRSLPLLRTSL